MKMKRWNKYSYSMILLFVTSYCGAQNKYQFTRVNDFYSTVIMEASDGGIIEINPDPVFTGSKVLFTSVKIEVAEPVAEPFIIEYLQKDGTLKLITSPINDVPDRVFSSVFSSALWIFDSPQSSIKINTGAYKGYLKVHLFYAPPLSNSLALPKLYKAESKCDKPTMISYTVWRTGLPDPKPPRLETKVEHLVVHHSAGNNGDTNYINTVRNIYLLHTQSNGWDDIGYNFLVAPNGVIFNGRDPQNVAADDNILGAHFCGKNQNTMGVCVMGDFMRVRPANNAIHSLEYLLAWKLKKERMDAFGQTVHPKETGSLLNNVCGHRDGCNTDCPGDSLYALLPMIKAEAARIADSCGLILMTKFFSQPKGLVVYPNPSSGSITISSDFKLNSPVFKIYGLTGNLIYETYFVSGRSIEIPLPDGLYYYRIEEEGGILVKGVLSVIH